MKNPPFLIGEALRFGWEKTQSHSAVLFQGMLTLFVLQVASSIVDKVLHNTLEGVLAMLALGVASIIVGAGFTVITLKIAKGEHVSYKDLIPRSRLVWNYFGASLISGLLVVLGLILLILPGVYLLVRFSMVRFAVIDGAEIMDSLSKSTALTDGIKWHLFGFLLVLLCLNIAGALAFMIGLLITVPVSAISYAHVYLKLKKHSLNATLS